MPRKILKAGYYIILTALGLVTVFLIATAVQGWGRYRVLVVMSGSMEPTIKTGSVILISRQADYQLGDIITFTHSNDNRTDLTTTHRIVSIDNSLSPAVYQTKGDANKAPDITPTAAPQIQGRVRVIIPYLGYLIAGFRRTLAFILLISLAAGLIIIGEIKKIWREINKKKV